MVHDPELDSLPNSFHRYQITPQSTLPVRSLADLPAWS